MDISGFDYRNDDSRAFPVRYPQATYSLAEHCKRFRVSYSTLTKHLTNKKKFKKLNRIGITVGDGCQRRHRRFTDAEFAELLQALGRRVA